MHRFKSILGNQTADECKAMALENITVYLNRILDDHAIDVQVTNNDYENATFELALYPFELLDSLLEAATLYVVNLK